MKFSNLVKIIFVISLFISVSDIAKAANVGDIVNFNVDKNFDASGRTKAAFTLIKIEPKLYFYVEKQWWDYQTQAKQSEILTSLDNLSKEFNDNIYPTLTSTFGSEWNPGIDNDPEISVLFEPINSTEGGYFRETDEYSKLQLPDSNEREMLYMSVSYIDNPDAKIILGHEFMHLITFNQKNKIFKAEEEVWLNEGRADYTSAILKYDNNYDGSNLQKRVADFIENPSDSVTDWSNTKYDYASVNLFIQYLVEHYGINILSDSLKNQSVGIESINQALLKNGAKENFSQIFADWTITLAINSCSQNPEYCYSDQNLKNLRISPTLIFLPLTGSSSLSATNITKDWSGNWQKIIGGNGDLKLEFSSLNGLNFQVPYIIYDKNGNYSVKFLQFDNNGKGDISLTGFGENYKSLVIIPSLQTKFSGFDGSELIYPYTIKVSITGQDSGTDQTLMQQLLAQIEDLKAQISKLQSQQGVITQECTRLSTDLYFGVRNDIDVRCLQEFLKNQGKSIYPEGLVTGNFASLTQQAVIRFQEKYVSEILAPIGLSRGTGYVGERTRAKINQIIKPL